MRLMVPLDGSDLSERALAPAARLARHVPESVIVLARVVRYPGAATGVDAAYVAMENSTLWDDAMEAARDYLRAVAQSPVLEGLEVEIIVEFGAPSLTLHAMAKFTQPDFIIMTSHGRTGISRAIMGSVAEDIAEHSTFPTLIVRPGGETFPDEGRFEPLTIMIPLDGTEVAETAIAPASIIARALHGSLYLLRVVPTLEDETPPAAMTEEAYAYLTDVHDRIEQQGVTVHRSLAWGNIADQIIAKAREHHADIVAIATHGRAGLARIMEGSIAETVLHHVELPVLITHAVPTTEK
jgi:nucleotide-binding universal stress UspA family protein